MGHTEFGYRSNADSQSLRVSRGSLLHLVVRIASYHCPVSPILVRPPGPHDHSHPSPHDVELHRVATVIGIVGAVTALLGIYVARSGRSSQSPEPGSRRTYAIPGLPYRMPTQLERSTGVAVRSGPRPLP
jgi:hypothetical protein